jgi:PPP family 3-phenylpropionic acid transporter
LQGPAWRLASFYAALCAVLGVQMPFLPVWFAAKGLDDASIGVTLAIPLIVRLAAIPMAAHIADRHHALRRVIIIAAFAALLGYVGVAFMESPVWIMAAVAVASCFYTPLMPLADAYALRGMGEQGHGYGPVRSWGSAAFIVSSVGGGLLLDAMPEHHLIWIVVAALAVNAAAALALGPLGKPGSDGSPNLASARMLLLDRRFLIVVVAAALIQASHAVYYGFSVLLWQSDGLSGGMIGLLWAIGVIAEIVLFTLSKWFALQPLTLLCLGAGGGIIRWGAMALDPPAALLPVLQCLHALTFGATHLGAVTFVMRGAPSSFGASAQGYLAVVLAIVMAGAMGVSGALYARFHSGAYLGMALLAAAGGIAVWFSNARRQRAAASPQG